jgi:phosphoenolpyruvate-protein phosphotransferase
LLPISANSSDLIQFSNGKEIVLEILKGIPASKGIAIAPGFIYMVGRAEPTRTQISDVDGELQRLMLAVETAKKELENVYQNALTSVGAEEAEIFAAQLLMLDDPDLMEAVEIKIRDEKLGAETAYHEAAEVYAEMLLELTEEYFRARAADVRDISRRVVRILQNKTETSVQLTRLSIILAEDLSPSDTIHFERSLIAGFFIAGGGSTSHSAILSRALGIPAIVGAGQIPTYLGNGGYLILDGDTGELIVDPDEATLTTYQRRLEEQQRVSSEFLKAAHLPAITRDHKQIEIAANIGGLPEAEQALAAGAEGAGLLRTEFLFLDRAEAPTEDEQYEVYSSIVSALGGKPVIVRTMDIGGDKPLPYIKLAPEANPFLGVRGVRLALKQPELLSDQLRAIYRAAKNGPVRIMFPMVSDIHEWRAVRWLAHEARDAVDGPQVELGIMIEVPSAALLAGVFAPELDFFSIGTNDLTQYTLAADRGNPALSTLSDGLHPSVLFLIQRTVEAAHANGCWVGVCGELGSDPLAVPVLVGLGVDELSVNMSAVPLVKAQVRTLIYAETQELAHQALGCVSADQVRALK